MRWIKRLLALLAILFVIAWIAVELILFYGARKLREDGVINFSSAAMLVHPAKIGAKYRDVSLGSLDSFVLSELAFWVPPWRPTELNIALPPQMTLDDEATSVALTKGLAKLRVAPLHGFNLSRASLEADAMAIDAQQVTGPFRVTAGLSNFGVTIPAAGTVAYEIDVAAQNIRLATIAHLLEQPGAAEAQDIFAEIDGRVLAWLATDTMDITGAFFRDLTLSASNETLLIRGYVMEDAEGVLQGKLALDFSDPRGFMLALQEAAIFPPDYVHLVSSMLENLATDSEALEAALPEEPVPAYTTSSDLHHEFNPDRRNSLPPRPQNTRRIIVTIADGDIKIGTMPVSALMRRLESAPSSPF